MYINSMVIYLIFIISGLCLGSFAGASMWRLRALQLRQDKSDGEEIDQNEYNNLKKLLQKSISKDHSRCLNCGYELKWFDLIPLISWITLKGKCRKCHTPIGWLEPLIELGVALFFILSYAFWPYGLDSGIEITRFIIWLVSGVCLAILFAYDKKWYILPDQINFTIIGLGILSSILVIISSQDKFATIISIIFAVFILSGIYWLLNRISNGKWIGFGDVKLGLGLALLLADWRLAFMALFFANLIGCIIVLPGLMSRKLKRDSHVPFGPMLIIGTAVAFISGNYLLNMYFFGLI